jgi:hypothetical protein
MSKRFGTLLFLPLLITLTGSQSAAADTPPSPTPAGLGDDPANIRQGAWPDWLQLRLAQAGDLASTAIFNAMQNINLATVGIGPTSSNVQMGRTVYDNHDVAHTFSVVDHILLNTQIPVYTGVWAPGNYDLTWGIGTTAGIEITDIRQSKQSSVPSYFTNYGQTQAQMNQWFSQYQANQSATPASDPQSPGNTEVVIQNNPPTTENGPSSWFGWDPLRKAEYSGLLNLLSFPTHIPFKAETLAKMEAGEIISYSATGSVELSAGASWNLDPTSITSIVEAGVTLTTYVQGKYQITVLKEDDRYARVKLTRLWTQGEGVTLGSQDSQSLLIRGLLIAKVKLKPTLSIVPFQFNANQDTGRSFDVGYRYDLNDPLARKAYEMAMLGRFAYSDELTHATVGAGAQTAPVTKVFASASRNSDDDEQTRIRLSLLFSQTKTADVSISDAKIAFPDGTYQILQGLADDEDKQTTLWGANQDFQFKFTSFLDKDGYAAGKPNSLRLLAEGFIDNSDTNAVQLYKYMDEVETIAGENNLFPRPPLQRPDCQPDHTCGTLPYGRSSFYYRLTLTQDQTLQFVHTPTAQMWSIVEKAFDEQPGTWQNAWNRGVFVVTHDAVNFADLSWLAAGEAPTVDSIERVQCAVRFVSNWQAMQKETDPTAIAKDLSELFATRNYGYPLMRALRLSLAADAVGYIVSGSNRSFGYIWDDKNAIADNAILERINREINFDQPWLNPETDTQAQVLNVTARALDANRVEIDFFSKESPVYLYLRLDQMGIFSDPTLMEIVIDNKNQQFVAGKNLLIIDASDGSIDQQFLKDLQPGQQYRISLAVSADSVHWGAIAQTKFKTPAAPATP